MGKLGRHYQKLDHCFHSPAIAVTRLSTGPRVGSDHLPLIVEWGLVKSGSETNSPAASGEARPTRAPYPITPREWLVTKVPL